ncbi:sigma-70 family RNA polymerase sigma factor [Undibacterium sp. TJN19]|uniref:sigma-70 family RNA polymerase sigma factor n=1 Tax=Undibacterium sp. TJN19 TaxID=3413055 RepID=UPI003BF0C879
MRARQCIIESYLPFARILAAKIFGRRIDNDLDFAEYMQFASLGLVQAVDQFDFSRDILFRTFATHRINGAILNGLEHMSEKREQISTRRRLNDERNNAIKSVIAEAEIDTFQQLAEIAISFAFGYILDNPHIYQHDEAITQESAYGGLELKQLREKVRALVERLPHKERLVIKSHYLNHLPFNVIAETLELSKGRIAQLHSSALKLLHRSIRNIEICDVIL